MLGRGRLRADRDRPASDVQVCPARLAFSLRAFIVRMKRERKRISFGRKKGREGVREGKWNDSFHGNCLILRPKFRTTPLALT